jgi:hypothetical protein
MRKLTSEVVIAKFKETHGDRYDYSKVNYRSSKTPVTIICPEHGDFEQTPGHHMRGVRCPGCALLAQGDARRYTTATFIEAARKVHGNDYDYSRVEYGQTNLCEVEIVCPEHGAFRQRAANHLFGKGCKKCADLRTGGAQALSEEEFFIKAREVHGDTYDYSRTVYRGTVRRITIVCPTHGEFEQIASNHVYQASGCPSCTTPGTSKLEQEVFDYVASIRSDVVQGDRSILAGKEIDIVIPSLGIGIEFNGIWHHSTAFNQDRNYHQKKTELAAAAGIRLIHIWSDEWVKKKDAVKGYLRRVLGCPQRKVWARKCEIVPTTGAEQRAFLETNHLQGMGVGGAGFALIFEGGVVAVALRIGNELARWCVKMDTDVVGGLSRVMRHFNTPLLSYCDLAKHTGDGYLSAGWRDAGLTKHPQTFFVKNQRRVSWQAAVAEAGGFARAVTEAAGFYRLNGCLQRKFMWCP